MSASPSLSVVVPSFEPAELDRVIAAVLPLRPLEILVVDSSPRPPAVAETGVVRLVHLPRRAFPGEARNEGARRARGEFLLFVDADVELTERTRAFVARFLDERPAEMAWGVYEADRAQGFTAHLQNRILRYRFTKAFRAQVVGYGQSSHLLVSRRLFAALGGFDPTLRMREDTDLCIRAAHLGHPVRVFEDFEARHLKRFGPATLLADYAARTFHAVRAQHRSPRRFRRAASQIGWRYRASWILGALLPAAIAAGVLAGVPPVAVAAAAAAILAAPLALCREALGGLSPGDAARALALWPAIGVALSAGTVAAAAWAVAEKAWARAVGAADWVRLAARVLRRDGLPVTVVHYVTARCHLRCAHCFYRERLDDPDPGEQSLARVERTAGEIGPVLWYALAGGEPFLRADLVEVHGALQRRCRPKLTTVPTNGWDDQAVFETTLRMLEQTRHGSLVVQVSLDGPRAMHDRIRGDGSFDRARATFRRLAPLRALFPELVLSVITVVSPANAEAFPAFVDEVIDDLGPDQLNVNLFRHGTREHPPLPAATLAAYRAAIDRYAERLAAGRLPRLEFLGAGSLRVKEVLQKELIWRVAAHDEFVTPCTAGTLGFVIWEDGRVAPCEILPDAVGRLAADGSGFRALVRSGEARALRRRIRDERCRCTWECAMSANTYFSWPFAGRLVAGTLRAALGGGAPGTAAAAPAAPGGAVEP